MADETRQLPAGMQAGPNALPEIHQVLVDEMGVANPTLDISAYIEYRFYKCQSCGKKEHAGGADTAPTAACTCTIGDADPKTKKFQHGVMKLLLYKSPRPGQEHQHPAAPVAAPEPALAKRK